MGAPKVSNGEKISSNDECEVLQFPTPFWEFTCYKVEIKKQNGKSTPLKFNHPAIAIVLEGAADLHVNNEEHKLSRASS